MVASRPRGEVRIRDVNDLEALVPAAIRLAVHDSPYPLGGGPVVFPIIGLVRLAP